jgi:hypothetical protein
MNLLRYGIKNTICVGGTMCLRRVAELTRKGNSNSFTDGDREGELFIKELLQVANNDYIARAPMQECRGSCTKGNCQALSRSYQIQVMDKYSWRIGFHEGSGSSEGTRNQKKEDLWDPEGAAQLSWENARSSSVNSLRTCRRSRCLRRSSGCCGSRSLNSRQLQKCSSRMLYELMGTFGARFLDAGYNVIGRLQCVILSIT